MLRQTIKDNQGDAIMKALHALGFSGVEKTRMGKTFIIDVDGRIYKGEKLIKLVESTVLVNLVMENYTIEKLNSDGTVTLVNEYVQAETSFVNG